MNTEELTALLNAQHKANIEAMAKNTTAMTDLSARLVALEQHVAGMHAGGGPGPRGPAGAARLRPLTA